MDRKIFRGEITKHKAYSGTVWEAEVAYSRATRTGNYIAVSGTTAVDENGEIVGKGNLYEQARFIFNKIEAALVECGATLNDVIRTRMFVTDIKRFDEVARAHKEVFSGIDPAATCVEVRALVNPELLVEIEADAVLESAEYE